MRKAFGLLARLKGLRGGALDLFGRTEERKIERALIQQYRDCIDELLQTLDADHGCRWPPRSRASRKRSAATATSRNATCKAARLKWDGLMAQWRAGAERKAA